MFSDVLRMLSDAHRCSRCVQMISDVQRCFQVFIDVIGCSLDVLLMLAWCSQDLSIMFTGCSQDVCISNGNIVYYDQKEFDDPQVSDDP